MTLKVSPVIELIERNCKTDTYLFHVKQMAYIHFQRGYDAELLLIRCDRCCKKSTCIKWTKKKTLVDTWGYIQFDDETVCSTCLDDGGWAGTVFTGANKCQKS